MGCDEMNRWEQGVSGGLEGRLERCFLSLGSGSCSLSGTCALHHLLGLLLPHAALSHRLEQPAPTDLIMLYHHTHRNVPHTLMQSFSVTHFSISGAQWTKSWLQNLKAGFLISSIKVIRSPHGCGLFTISLSRSTLYHEKHTTH